MRELEQERVQRQTEINSLRKMQTVQNINQHTDYLQATHQGSARELNEFLSQNYQVLKSEKMQEQQLKYAKREVAYNEEYIA
jgi:hypothetical protein